MTAPKGYVLILAPNRAEIFYEHLNREEDNFAEPVDEFVHSRNVPLICFIQGYKGHITHIASGSRASKAGTEIRKLNLEGIYELEKAIDIDYIPSYLSSSVQNYVYKKLKKGGLIATKSFYELVDAIKILAPDTTDILNRYSKTRALRISKLPDKIRTNLAEQKETLLTALQIAEIDRDDTLDWDVKEDEVPQSFLQGLQSACLREDQILINDLTNVPGFNYIRSSSYSAAFFENDDTKLTVIMANRLPLEELTGTDLIYYNQTFSCFILVQYKAMEDEARDEAGNKEHIFRIPNDQLKKEISRMDLLYETLKKCDGNVELDSYRFNDNPFFLKICPRIVFNPDDARVTPGMYLPLDYWKKLENDQCIDGPKGGKGVTYKNVKRYFDNTEFATLVAKAWVGTTINQSQLLEEIIKKTIESGRAVTLAVKEDKPKPKPQPRLRIEGEGLFEEIQ